MTITGLARYAQACLSPPAGAVGDAIKAAQQPQVDAGDGRSQALGWIVTAAGQQLNAGANPGSSSCLAIDTTQGRAIALASSRHGLAGELTEAAITALGR